MVPASNDMERRFSSLEKKVEKLEEYAGDVRDFITEARTIEAQGDKQHEGNKWRLNFIIALASLVAMILLAIGGWIVTINIHRSLSDPHQIFHSYNPEPVVASDARLPSDYLAR